MPCICNNDNIYTDIYIYIKYIYTDNVYATYSENFWEPFFPFKPTSPTKRAALQKRHDEEADRFKGIDRAVFIGARLRDPTEPLP